VITESADQILGDLEIKARNDDVELPSDIDLVLEIVPQNDGPICGYYFVEHKSRCLFWLEEFDAEPLCRPVKAIVSLSHLRELSLAPITYLCNLLICSVGYEIESQYW
jgi:hypothetical protein